MSRTLGVARVSARREVASGSWLIDLEVELEETVRPGQFAMVHPLKDAFLLPRPFSILDYQEGTLRLLVKEVGAGSRLLAHLPVEEELRVFAPLGVGFPLKEFRDREVVLVAGGVGLVPLWRLREDLLAAGEREPLALFGARTMADLPLPLLQGWRIRVEEDGASAGGEGLVAMKDPVRGPADKEFPAVEKGLVTLGLKEILDGRRGAAVALCGPDPMMKAAARIAHELGVEVWVCLEEQMACGAGVCRSCAVKAAGGDAMKTVCKDGPVFRLDEIDYV